MKFTSTKSTQFSVFLKFFRAIQYFFLFFRDFCKYFEAHQSRMIWEAAVYYENCRQKLAEAHVLLE